jgi:hypothetical protein
MEELAQTYLSLFLAPLLGETALVVDCCRCSDECPLLASLLRRRSPWWCLENLMQGGVSTAAAIPLQGFLPRGRR